MALLLAQWPIFMGRQGLQEAQVLPMELTKE